MHVEMGLDDQRWVLDEKTLFENPLNQEYEFIESLKWPKVKEAYIYMMSNWSYVVLEIFQNVFAQTALCRADFGRVYGGLKNQSGARST